MSVLIKKLFDYQRKNLLFLVLSGIVYLAIFIMIIWLSTFIADSVFQFSGPVRWAILVFNSLLSGMLVWRLFLKNFIALHMLKTDSDFNRVADEIGRHNPGISDRYKNIYQLLTNKPIGASAELQATAIDEFSEEIKGSAFEKRLHLKKYLPRLHIIILSLLGSFALVTGVQDEILRSAKRIFNPTRNYESVPPFSFAVSPGATKLFQGDDLEVETLYAGPLIQKCILEYKHPKDPYFRQMTMAAEDGHYTTTVKNIRNPLEYRVRAISDVPFSWGDQLISEQYKVNMIIPPLINNLEVELIPPSYTGLPKQFLDKNVGDIIAYPGTAVRVRARTNLDIINASILFNDESKIAARVRENSLNADFRVRRNGSYKIAIEDKDYVSNQNPIEYSITVVDDLYPTVEITEPGDDIELSADAGLAILMEGNDDFGFTNLVLHYQILSKLEAIRDTTWIRIPINIPAGSRTFFQQTYLWNFATVSIGFDDVIRYYALLKDNDIVSGPKEARSRIYTIRFPSIDQMFAEFQQDQDENIEDLEKTVEKSEELKQALEEINRELKREKELDWQRRREMENALEKQKDIQSKIEEIQEKLEEAVKQLESNNLLNPELLQKYNQLQELFREIATPELLKAMEDLQKAVEKMDAQQAQNAMQRFKINQEKFRENLERTMELFKKIQLEQQMDRLVQMAEKLAEQQKDITENIENNAVSERLKQQEDLTTSIEKNLDPLVNERMMNQYSEAMKSLEKAQEQLKQDNLQERLKNLKQELEGQNFKADQRQKDQSQKLEQDMSALQQQLQQAQKNMQQQDKEQILSNMEKTTENLLRLSKEEESLLSKTQEVSALSDQYRELATQQQILSENMVRVIKDLIDLSRQTFFISPEMNQSLGRANSGMRKSLQELEGRNGQRARRSQEQAMEGLNDAVVQMQSSMNQLSQSNSALGFEQFLERMQQMAGQQGQVNQESMELMQGQGSQGGLSLEQQGRYQRLAAEQRAIREALKNMDSEMGNRPDIAGRLDKMAEEMEDVIKDLEALQVDRKTIDRQQQILSRMLDAQKSVREREYSRQRKAEVGKFYARKSPDENAESTDRRLKRLTVELLKALQEGYVPDYEKMIESYFQELNRQNLQE